jgi:cell division protein FtsW
MSLFGKIFPKDDGTGGQQVGGVDPVLAAVAIALVGMGVVMVYSASAVEATVSFKDPQYFLKRQGMYAVAALALMWAVSRFDYRRLRHGLITYLIYGGVVGMLFACVIGLGKRVGGATRWIALGPVNIQPAETAKLALVLWLAYSLAKKGDKVKSFTVGFVPHLLAAGLMILLLLKQPDLGSSVVLLLITFSLLFSAGAKLGYILGATIIASGGVTWLIMSKAYRLARLLAFIDMDHHRRDVAYQPFQSVMSFGSGGISGLGLGRGLQVLYLPEAHTDFIAAIIGEELGFIGILGLVGGYLLLVSRGIRTALHAQDDYGSYVAFGISTLFGIQVLVNLSVAMAIVPTKGLTLPFMSFGGSSLLVNAAAVGLLLSVSRRRVGAPVRGSAASAVADPPAENSNRKPALAPALDPTLLTSPEEAKP